MMEKTSGLAGIPAPPESSQVDSGGAGGFGAQASETTGQIACSQSASSRDRGTQGEILHRAGG